MSLKDEQAQLWGKKTTEVAEEYWNNQSHMRRANWFGNHIKVYEIDSIFEVGIMGGKNLKTIVDKTGIETFGGIDVSSASVDWAREKLPEGQFSVESVYDMDIEQKYDMVFTIGVLIHVPPDGILQALQRCLDKATRYVMHIEAYANDIILKGPEEMNPRRVANKFQWRPNLIDYYSKLGYTATCNRLPPKQRGRDVSHIIQVDKKWIDKVNRDA